MKKMFLRSLLWVTVLSISFVQAGEPGKFTLPEEPAQFHTGNQATDHLHTEDHNAEALRLERIQQEEDLQRLLTQKHLTQDPLPPHVKQGNAEGTSLLLVPAGRDTATDKDLTTEQLKALKTEEHHGFTRTPSSTTSHPADHHGLPGHVRTTIIQHLKNELTTIRKTLTDEQIKNREMVIEFFGKAGELTKENLKEFHNIYKKLTEWKEGTELTLTPEEQKEMKLFLQSLISTYCSKRQSVEKAL